MSTANFFSNRDSNLPNINIKHLPRIKKSLPNIQMQGESDLLFEIDGKNILLDDVAEKYSNLFFNS